MINGVEELMFILEGMDSTRNFELGRLAYEVYCCRLAEHQPAETITWNRLPPYMHDVWTLVAEVVEVYVKDRDHHK